jgi:hypothetical protein
LRRAEEVRHSPSGTETRQRHNDVRIRLNDDEIAIFDAEIARAGFRGQQARGDWLRAQLGIAPTRVHAAEEAVHQRVPLPGGQALLADLGKVGSRLRKLENLLPAIPKGYLDDADEARIRGKLGGWISDLLEQVTTVIHKVDAHLDQLGNRP